MSNHITGGKFTSTDINYIKQSHVILYMMPIKSDKIYLYTVHNTSSGYPIEW